MLPLLSCIHVSCASPVAFALGPPTVSDRIQRLEGTASREQHADEPCPWDDSHQLVRAYVVGEDNEDPGMDVRCGMPGRIVCHRRRRPPHMCSTCVSQCIPCYVSTRTATGLLCTYQTNQEHFSRARHPDYGYIKLRASAVIYCV
ncbi:hypothetical protein IQ06DRAFT_82789 [Phaeosphaeriaceae sp. SRC1lsM3a]|nr:hypothetical protein IQ06DRAFT_82789 [Stagonospora sp. SRC1lsM3a]